MNEFSVTAAQMLKLAIILAFINTIPGLEVVDQFFQILDHPRIGSPLQTYFSKNFPKHPYVRSIFNIDRFDQGTKRSVFYIGSPLFRTPSGGLFALPEESWSHNNVFTVPLDEREKLILGGQRKYRNLEVNIHGRVHTVELRSLLVTRVSGGLQVAVWPADKQYHGACVNSRNIALNVTSDGKKVTIDEHLAVSNGVPLPHENYFEVEQIVLIVDYTDEPQDRVDEYAWNKEHRIESQQTFSDESSAFKDQRSADHVSKLGYRYLQSMHSVQSSTVVIKQTGAELQNNDVDRDYELEGNYVLEIELICEEDSSGQLTVSAAYHQMTASVLETTTPLGTFSCNSSTELPPPQLLLNPPKTPNPSSTPSDHISPPIHRIRLPLTRKIQSGSSLLLTNTGPSPLYYLARLSATSPTTETPNGKHRHTSEPVSQHANLDNELHYFRSFVQDAPFFERFMGRNRHVRYGMREDYSQLLLVVACTAFVCLCVVSVIVIIKLGGPRKSLIDVFDVALMQEEAPVVHFEPGKGKYENSDSCCICMEDFQPDEEISEIRKCSHRLHPSCLEQWVIRNQQCPLCKVNLLLTRQLVMISTKKAKLYATHGLSKREIAQIESRIKVDESSRFYFVRPPPKQLIKKPSSTQEPQTSGSDGVKHRYVTKRTRSRRSKGIVRQRCSHLGCRLKNQRAKRIVPLLDSKNKPNQVQRSEVTSTERGLQSVGTVRDQFPSEGTLLRDGLPQGLHTPGTPLDTSSANLL